VCLCYSPSFFCSCSGDLRALHSFPTRRSSDLDAENNIVLSDAFLCQLPKQGNQEIYSFLLQENYSFQSHFFSLHEGNIVLSRLYYDAEITLEQGKNLFAEMFEKADYYDTLLIEQYHCLPIARES